MPRQVCVQTVLSFPTSESPLLLPEVECLWRLFGRLGATCAQRMNLARRKPLLFWSRRVSALHVPRSRKWRRLCRSLPVPPICCTSSDRFGVAVQCEYVASLRMPSRRAAHSSHPARRHADTRQPHRRARTRCSKSRGRARGSKPVPLLETGAVQHGRMCPL